MNQPKYKIYPSLLDAYQWYLDSESDNAFQELIDKINRVPFESEASAKGTAFNELVDELAKNGFEETKDEVIAHKGFFFPKQITIDIVNEIKGAIPQVLVAGLMLTRYGMVQLYGYIDELLRGCMVVDIKTTGKYEFPKYLKAWQHIVYPYCLTTQAEADWKFTYLITDFNNIYAEAYDFNPESDVKKLRSFVEQFIEFLESHREIIADRKIFGGEKEILT